jgi:hypothetical protein
MTSQTDRLPTAVLKWIGHTKQIQSAGFLPYPEICEVAHPPLLTPGSDTSLGLIPERSPLGDRLLPDGPRNPGQSSQHEDASRPLASLHGY